jgi:hypothetical protein
MYIYFAVFLFVPPLYIKAGPGPAPGFSRDSVPRFLSVFFPCPLFSLKTGGTEGSPNNPLIFPFQWQESTEQSPPSRLLHSA